MKILLLDIETSPLTAYTWGLWKQNIPISSIVDSGGVMCWAAKWRGSRELMFSSTYHQSEHRMLRRIHKLLTEADAVIHYNGASFDIPTLNKEFVQKGMLPPEPYKQIDLLHVVRKQFRFPSNKLDYVAQALGVGAKVRHAGFQMWVKCMAGDDAAWTMMERYNRGDVTVLEKLYERLLPWIPSHPNMGAFKGHDCCPTCGSTEWQRRGEATTQVYRYPRYQCKKCGTWFRGAYSIKQPDRLKRFRPVAG